MMLGPSLYRQERHMYTRQGQKIIDWYVYTSIWPVFLFVSLAVLAPVIFEWIPMPFTYSPWWAIGLLSMTVVLMWINYDAGNKCAHRNGNMRKELIRKEYQDEKQFQYEKGDE